jgi:hypothetical protein
MTYAPLPPAPRKRFGTRSIIAMVAGGAVFLLLACCGGFSALGLLAGGKPTAAPTQHAIADTREAPSNPDEQVEVSPTAAPSPVVERQTITETQTIPYSTKRVNDSSLAKGTTKVKTQGVNGEKTLTYEVTYTDGVQTAKKLVKTVVTKDPVTKVILVGTKTSSPSCDPNYEWACVPIASDVDCAGGSGNGPAYVQGPVKVVGNDVYDLDSDNDGIGCE